MMKAKAKSATLFLVGLFAAACLLFSSVWAMTAGKLTAGAATGDSSTAGYHVGDSIDLGQDAEVYTDSTYTTIGRPDGNTRHADTDFIYKAVFPAGTEDAFVGFEIQADCLNVKVEYTTDIADSDSWTTILQSEKVDGAWKLPTSPEDGVFASQNWPNADGWWDYYYELTDALADTGDTAVYVRFSKADAADSAKGTRAGGLRFFTGNAVNKDSGAFAFVGSRELCYLDGNSGFNTSTLFAHSGKLTQGWSQPGVAGHGIYTDQGAYLAWQFKVAADATSVNVFFNAQGGQDNLGMTVFAGNEVVYANSVESKDHNIASGQMSVDLTEELADLLATDEDFNILVMWRDLTPLDGGGPYTNYITFSYELEAGVEADDVAPDYDGDGILYGEKVAEFNAKDGTKDLTMNGVVENNDNVVYLKGGYDNGPYFDSWNSQGIFKLDYDAGDVGGYLEIQLSSNYMISVYSGADWNVQKAHPHGGLDAATGGDEYIEFTNFDVVALTNDNISDQKIYIDVSDYLDEAGGTLYIRFNDPTMINGSGPKVTGNIALYQWKEDATDFSASYDNSNPVKEDAIADIVITMTMSSNEEIGRVRIDGTNVGTENYSYADGKLTIKKAALEGLSVGDHTIEIMSTSGRSAQVTYTIAAAEQGGGNENPGDNQDDETTGCGAIVGGTSVILGAAVLAGACVLVAKKRRSAK